jgi:hypothetical protein
VQRSGIAAFTEPVPFVDLVFRDPDTSRSELICHYPPDGRAAPAPGRAQMGARPEARRRRGVIAGA